MQINNYYPFGLNMEGNWNGSFADAKNKYQYNGKEWNDDFGLGWNDYGARFYDPAIGRWGNVDPSAEKYLNSSPYNYALNNPLKYIDPDGKSAILTYDKATDTWTLTMTIYIYGSYADQEGFNAQNFANNMASQWGKAYEDCGMNVKLNVKGEYIGRSGDKSVEVVVAERMSEVKAQQQNGDLNAYQYNFVRAENLGNNLSSNTGTKAGGNSAMINMDQVKKTPTTRPHEFGHLLGLGHLNPMPRQGSDTQGIPYMMSNLWDFSGLTRLNNNDLNKRMIQPSELVKVLDKANIINNITRIIFNSSASFNVIDSKGNPTPFTQILSQYKASRGK